MNNAVEVSGLEKRFGKFVAVNRIHFEVRQGEIFGFLGPNGAGKSTTIRMLCGILLPSGGKGSVGGYDIVRQQEKIKQNIGYMSQKFSLYDDLTVEENIDFYSGIYNVPSRKKNERKEWVISMAGLGEMRTSRTQILSGGWKQRLALGCAILHEPRIVFLDEPTSGVDPMSRQNFWSIIKDMAKKGVTVFVTTHYMDEAEQCDRMALIYKGNIIALGTPGQLKSDFMKDTVLEVSLPDAQEWIEKILKIQGVKEVSLFGVNVHAVVERENVAAFIKEMFIQNNVKDFMIKPITASLEDVFVSLIEAYDKKEKQ